MRLSGQSNIFLRRDFKWKKKRGIKEFPPTDEIFMREKLLLLLSSIHLFSFC